MRIADGKHFLDIIVAQGELRARVLCNAQPDRNPDAACRMAPDAPQCVIKESWASLDVDMLATPHHSIREIHAWVCPLPIIYLSEGLGEDFEDWVVPDTEHPTYLRAIERARRLVLDEENA